MKHKWNRLLPALFVLLLVTGCLSPRKQMIFKGMEYDARYKAVPPEELRIQKFDKLNIEILSDVPQLAAPFNASINYTESSSAPATMVPYAVSREGTIDFPKLGVCVVEGMTTLDLERTLAAALRDKGYIKDPIVKVVLQRFEITVIGDANELVTIDGGLNLIQLLARVGGPSANFRMDDVMVIRTIDGARVPHKVDLRTKEVFDSPVFYLQQNDIVYLKPRIAKIDPAIQGLLTPITMIATLGSTITSALVLVRLSK